MDLREYLFRHDIKIRDFADKVGYTRNYLSSVCSGMSTPSKRCAKAISLATEGIVPIDGICTRKRGKALELAKKKEECQQMTFPEIQK
jgi:transcriptional regulator with XRE-family HTH domain